MRPLYGWNGLIFWTEREIRIRETIAKHVVEEVKDNLRDQNRAFEFLQVEAPMLTPRDFINPNYDIDDMYAADIAAHADNPVVSGKGLVLRPETTMGSYEYARYLLEHHTGYKLPLCVWQHGKSFRREKDHTLPWMRLKEFWQLEFQILFSPTTGKDYSIDLIPSVVRALGLFIPNLVVGESERLPDYAEWTKDIISYDRIRSMELASISRRKDAGFAQCLEVSVGTDRCVYCVEDDDDRLNKEV